MGELFTYFSITGLINAIISLGFALYLVITSWKIRLARYLIYFCLAVGSWSTGYFLWQISTTHSDALFWSRFLMAGAIFTSISFLHLVIIFLGYDKLRFYKMMLIIFYIPCFFWEIFNFTPLFVADVGRRLFFEFWPLPGPFYLPYLILFFLHLFIAFGLLCKKHKCSIGIEKRQALMLLIGISLTFGGGITNYFLWYNIPIAPWGNGLAAAYVIFSTYAIMRYGLLNLKVVAADFFTGLLIVLSFVDLLLSEDVSRLSFNLVKTIILAVVGFMIIRSARHEIQRREEITELAASLEKAKHQLEEANAEKVVAISMAADQLQSSTKNDITVLSKQHLINFVNTFVSISRLGQKESFHFGPVDVNKMMEKIIAMFDEHMAGNTRSIIKWEPIIDTEGLKLDEEKISQAIIILLDNALKYGKGEEIIIKTTRQEFGLAVCVVDGGMGFMNEEHDKLYHQPYRGAQAIAFNPYGTGLSLCIVRQIAEAHGGRVWTHSRGLDKGSEFGFWVPGEKKYPWD